MIDIEDQDPRFIAREWVEFNVIGGVPNATPNPPDIEEDGESLFKDE
jgi:hypothetical protein